MNRYFEYLCSIVDEDGSREYDKLLNELHGIDFYSLIPNDDNRGEDGKQLRERFEDEEGGPQGLSLSHDKPCTGLEMLIGLAYRLEFESANSRWEKTPSEWFWILLDNLGLGWCDNEHFRQMKNTDEIHEKIGIFLDRHYKSDGSGGLFPLREPRKDQRRIEVWYQMSAYIMENYGI
jgi:hypothetical protein